jgi:hypothetical protein
MRSSDKKGSIPPSQEDFMKAVEEDRVTEVLDFITSISYTLEPT